MVHNDAREERYIPTYDDEGEKKQLRVEKRKRTHESEKENDKGVAKIDARAQIN